MFGRACVNLASEPFRRDRPALVASAAAGLVLAALLALLISLAVTERGRAAEISGAIERLRAQLRSLNGEQARLEGALRRTENAEVLDRSRFLNGLLHRKGISWTKIFDDLEKVMPHNVRLFAVRPQVNPQNEIYLDMVVGAESGPPVVEMLKNLEASPQFGDTYIHSTTPPSPSEPLVRYRVTVNYAQKM
jgi:type IV pilus assembly protein PilN